MKAVLVLTGSCPIARLLVEPTSLAAAIISPAAAQSTDVEMETIKYASGSIQVEGYLAKPSGTGKFPAILVIHENRSLNEQIRDVARRLAAEGFVALAPDLLSRVGGTASMKSVNQAATAIERLAVPEAIGDLREGFTYLAKHPSVDPQRVSCVGFGWGAWRGFTLATQIPNLHRVVIFYGTTPDAGLDRINAPVLAHYASRDPAITGNVPWTAREMKRLGKRFTYYIYENTEQGFFNDMNAPRYDPEAAKLAWSRTLQFLNT